MKYYWSESYESVFRSDIHKAIPDDAIEITESEFLDKISEINNV